MCSTLLMSRPCLSRELAVAVDVAAVATEVLAMAIVVDMALAVAVVLSMAMKATKVCFLFDCCVLFSILLYSPYPMPMQQQRKLQAGGLGLQHGPGGASSAL